MSPLRNLAFAVARFRRSLPLTGVSALSIATLAAACADGPSAPVASEALTATERPSFATTTTKPLSLNQQLEAEKRRIFLESERSKRTYDALKVEWARLEQQHPNGNPELLYCDPLQYTGTTKIIGPEGGDLDFGPHKLSIPRGALAKATVITGEMPVALTVGARFSPHGLQFAKGVKLTLSYKHCNRPTSFLEQIVYVDGLNTILERPLSVDRTNDGLVDATIWHFSGYMVSTGRRGR
ncbi:MAG: hypothetical protein ACXWZS_15610 [Gemmatirosa sp.]